MWRLDIQTEYIRPETGESGVTTKTFLFKTEAQRHKWLEEKHPIKAGMDEINDAFEHKKKCIHLSREEYDLKTNTWLANVETFKQNWGDHMLPPDIEYNTVAMQKSKGLPMTKWPVVHVYESGSIRKLMVFDDHMSFAKWNKEAMELQNKLHEFNPEDLSKTKDRNLAYRWMLSAVQFHHTWGHKMVPNLLGPLQMIETALDAPPSGIEAGCWSFYEPAVGDQEGLLWLGSLEL